MPRYHPNTRFSDCWASVGDITFYHRNGLCYYRSRSRPAFPGTPAQLEQKSLHHRAITAWKSLDHDTQSQWNRYARDVYPHRPPFDRSSHISGYNLFVSAYHGLAQTGDERTPAPFPFTQFPALHLELMDAALTGDSITLCFKATSSPCDNFRRFRVLGKIQTGIPGTGRNPGKMRNYISSTELTEDTLILFHIPGQGHRYSAGLQIHMKYTLIDTLTGYRAQYQSLSAITTLQSQAERQPQEK